MVESTVTTKEGKVNGQNIYCSQDREREEDNINKQKVVGQEKGLKGKAEEKSEGMHRRKNESKSVSGLGPLKRMKQ
ncbi:hypothetical protein XENTR_v10013465 [Xenopus tropicalis]|nr:hypothetical protein XENTR_v10013465 [Xenopus tropicalis]